MNHHYKFSVARQQLRRRLALCAAAVLLTPIWAVTGTVAAGAGVTLTVSPITWDVVGLDSNDVDTGPDTFPAGQRICNTGTQPATSVSAGWVWDSTNSYIRLATGSLATVELGALAAGTCADAYFNVVIARSPSAYDTTRRYHVIAVDAGTGTSGTSPMQREIYVEHLVSQNRNTTLNISVNGTEIPAGGTIEVLVGGTYTIELAGSTSTNGYNQLEMFLNLRNDLFQVMSVTSTYAADTSPTVSSPWDKLYGDACTWDADYASPNYRSCANDGKVGGLATVTYTVKVLSGAGAALAFDPMIYDFSGSSYHYNSDFTAAGRSLQIALPGSVDIAKSFSPRSVEPGSVSTLTFTISNPNNTTANDVHFVDALPSGLTVADVPAASTAGCGAGTFSPSPAAGDSTLSFTNATVAALGTCTASIDVVASADGTYTNTTDHLFIEGITDTGNTASDTLLVTTASTCNDGAILAKWSVPAGATNPPDGTGGVPDTMSSLVTSATASVALPINSSINATNGVGDTSSWSAYGWKTAGQYYSFTLDTSAFGAVAMTFDMANPGGMNGPASVILEYSTGGAFTTVQTISNPAASFTAHSQDFSGLTNGSGSTTFRIRGTGANNDNSGGALLLDNISFTGCADAVPPPSLTKQFSTDVAKVGDEVTLTFTIDNSALASAALTGVSMTDELPAGLAVTDGSQSACGGTIVRTSSTSTLELSSATVAAGDTCTFTVAVTLTAVGTSHNITGFLFTNETGPTPSYGTDSITAVGPPVLTKWFSAPAIYTGSTSTLWFRIDNPNPTALTDVAFSDTLPSGVTVGSSSQGACGGTVTATAGTGVIALSGATLAAGSSCTFSLTVTGATSGAKSNLTGPITTNESDPGGPATALLSVADRTPAVDLVKSTATSATGPWQRATAVVEGASIYYRFTVYNAGEVTLTNIAIDDPSLAGTAFDPVDCDWLTALPLEPGESASCVVGPLVAPVGSTTNTAQVTADIEGGGTTASTESTATSQTTSLQITKSTNPPPYTEPGDELPYTYAVTNNGYAPLPGPVVVTDERGTVVCPDVTTVGDGDTYLDPGETITCTATYVVTEEDVTNGMVSNAATATAGGVTSNLISFFFTRELVTDLSVMKDDFATVIMAGHSTVYTIRVVNNGTSPAVGAVLADPVVVGMSATAIACSTEFDNRCLTPPTVSELTGAGAVLPTLDGGSFYEIRVTVQVGTTSGPVSNTVTVVPASGSTDTNLTNNIAVDTDLVSALPVLPSSGSASSLIALFAGALLVAGLGLRRIGLPRK